MTPNLSRDAQLVKFFAQQYPGIPRKHLVKLIYMTDLLAREYLGEPVSSFAWYRHDHGPYDRRIEAAVAELVDAGLVEERRESWFRGRYHRITDLHQPVPFEFSLPEQAVLDYVAANYVSMPTKELIEDVVYPTEPFRRTSRKGERLPMEIANHTGTTRVGFRLEEVLRAEQEARGGSFATLSEFVDELRSQAPA